MCQGLQADLTPRQRRIDKQDEKDSDRSRALASLRRDRFPASARRARSALSIFPTSTPLASSRSKPLYIGDMIDASTAPVESAMTSRLTAALSPTRLEFEDQSAHHIGHAGHDDSHFALVIESPAFSGQSRVARQRMVYAALGDLMHDRVHALTIRALAPGEA